MAGFSSMARLSVFGQDVWCCAVSGDELRSLSSGLIYDERLPHLSGSMNMEMKKVFYLFDSFRLFFSPLLFFCALSIVSQLAISVPIPHMHTPFRFVLSLARALTLPISPYISLLACLSSISSQAACHAQASPEESPLYVFERHFADLAPQLARDYTEPRCFTADAPHGSDLFALLGEQARQIGRAHV